LKYYLDDKPSNNPLENEDLYAKLMEMDPVHSNMAKGLRYKLNLVYRINRAKAFFVNSDLLNIDGITAKNTMCNFDFVPLVLICSYLINGVSVLLEGGAGSGKSTIVKILNKMLTGYPISKLEDTILRCDPELTKEQVSGFLDIGELMGDEHRIKVIWSPWITSYDDGNIGWIVDEINHAPPRVQNMLHSIMAEKIMKYQNRSKSVKEFRLVMTQNPMTLHDTTGKFPKSMSFLSRIWISIPVKQASAPDLAMIEDVRSDRREYHKELDDVVPNVMSLNELRAASILASRIHISHDAKKYTYYLTREVNLCVRAPRNDKTLCTTLFPSQGLCTALGSCHFNSSGSVCQKIYGGSARESNALIKFGQALVFFLGEENMDSVHPYHIRALAPYILTHKCYIPQTALKKEEHFFGNLHKFVESNLVQYCFTKLESRKKAEIAFKKLFRGEGTREDLEELKKSSSSDIYVCLDLFPKVVELEKGNTKPPWKIERSTLDELYKNYMQSIIQIEEDMSLSASEKVEHITNLIDEINEKPEIPFRSNLFDRAYILLTKLGLG
jgi:MoxR-like ATPase